MKKCNISNRILKCQDNCNLYPKKEREKVIVLHRMKRITEHERGNISENIGPVWFLFLKTQRIFF